MRERNMVMGRLADDVGCYGYVKNGPLVLKFETQEEDVTFLLIHDGI